MTTMEQQRLDRAKKEAKRLLVLARAAHGHLRISTLSEAQRAIASLRGYASWHEMEASCKQGQNASAPIAASEELASGGSLAQAAAIAGQRMAPKNGLALCDAFPVSGEGIACLLEDGGSARLSLLGRNAQLHAGNQLIITEPGFGAASVLSGALREARKREDPRDFVIYSLSEQHMKPFMESGEPGERLCVMELPRGGFAAINPLDCHPGARSPLGGEIEELLDLLCELCGGGEAERSALRLATIKAYERRSDRAEPFSYAESVFPDVDAALLKFSSRPGSWWEASDALSAQGLGDLAWKAQARATPSIDDIAQALPSLDDIYGKVIFGSSARPMLPVLAERLLGARAAYPEMFGPTTVFPKAAPRRIFFNLCERSDALRRKVCARFLWAKKISSRWIPSLAKAALSQWDQVDVGASVGAEERKRSLAARFKKASGLPGACVVIDHLNAFGLSELALRALRAQARVFQQGGKNSLTLLMQGEPGLEWASLSNLRVRVSGLRPGRVELAVEGRGAWGFTSGALAYLVSALELWDCASHSADQIMMRVAREGAGPERSIRALSVAYPNGTWRHRAEELASELPWDALTPQEQWDLAREELNRVLGG